MATWPGGGIKLLSSSKHLGARALVRHTMLTMCQNSAVVAKKALQCLPEVVHPQGCTEVTWSEGLHA